MQITDSKKDKGKQWIYPKKNTSNNNKKEERRKKLMFWHVLQREPCLKSNFINSFISFKHPSRQSSSWNRTPQRASICVYKRKTASTSSNVTHLIWHSFNILSFELLIYIFRRRNRHTQKIILHSREFDL